jgi:hypothetical protein
MLSPWRVDAGGEAGLNSSVHRRLAIIGDELSGGGKQRECNL